MSEKLRNSDMSRLVAPGPRYPLKLEVPKFAPLTGRKGLRIKIRRAVYAVPDSGDIRQDLVGDLLTARAIARTGGSRDCKWYAGEMGEDSIEAPATSHCRKHACLQIGLALPEGELIAGRPC